MKKGFVVFRNVRYFISKELYKTNSKNSQTIASLKDPLLNSGQMVNLGQKFAKNRCIITTSQEESCNEVSTQKFNEI